MVVNTCILYNHTQIGYKKKSFRDYMSQHLLKVRILNDLFILFHYMIFLIFKAGASIAPRPGDEMSRLPFLRTWLRTRNAIILHLSNGTIQVFF